MLSKLRARGVLRTAATWAVGLSVLASTLLVAGVELGVVPASIFGIRELVAVAIRAFIAGGVGGGLFALILARRERGRDVGQLTYRRTGASGFLGASALGALLALAAPAVLPVSVLVASTVGLGVLGGGFAMGTLALARRATGPAEHERLEHTASNRLPPAI